MTKIEPKPELKYIFFQDEAFSRSVDTCAEALWFQGTADVLTCAGKPEHVGACWAYLGSHEDRDRVLVEWWPRGIGPVAVPKKRR